MIKKGMLLAVALLAMTGCKEEKTEGEKPVVKIGVSLPLSGSYAAFSNNHKVAMGIAVDEMEAKGTKYDYELIFEDDALDLKRVQSNLQKFVNIDKVDIYTDLDSGSSNLANNVLKDKDILQFSWTADRKVASNRDLTFTFAGYSKNNSKVMIKELKKRNISKVNIFTQNVAVFNSILEALEPALKEANIKYKLYSFNGGEKNFRSTIQKSELNNAELNLVQFYSPDLEIFTKQMKEVNSDAKLSSIEAFSFSTNKELFNGNWFVMAAYEEGDNFLKKLNERVKTDTTASAEYSYTGYKMLLEACEKSSVKDDKIDVKEVAKNLLEMKEYKSTFGTWEVQEDGFIIIPSTVVNVENGKLKIAK